jgi:hypothetical protein
MIASVKVVNELEEAIGALLRGRKFGMIGKGVIGWCLCKIRDRSYLTSNSMRMYVDVSRSCELLIVLIDQIVKPEQKTLSCWSLWNKSEANKHSSGSCASLSSPIIWDLVLRSSPDVGLTSFDGWQELSRLMYHANLGANGHWLPKLSHGRLAGKTALN